MTLRRSRQLAYLLAAGQFGCGGHVPPAAAAASSTRSTAEWSEYELTGDGVFARFPSDPTETGASGADANSLHTLASEGSTSFSCQRVEWPHGESRSKVDVSRDIAASSFRSFVESREAPPVDGFSGIELTGFDINGRSTKLRAYFTGNSVAIARASARRGALDSASVSRFFESLHLRPPWHIRTLPELGISVAVPAWAVDTSTLQVALTKPWTAQAPILSLVAGDSVKILYAVAAGLVSEQSGASDRSLLDWAIALYSQQGRVVSSAPIEEDNVTGRELLLEHAQFATAFGAPENHIEPHYARLRLFARDGSLCAAVVSSVVKEKVLDFDSARFFESLRWYRH